MGEDVKRLKGYAPPQHLPPPPHQCYNDGKRDKKGVKMTKAEAKQKIAELVTKYQSLTPTDKKVFHEAKTKQGFIEPLFRALGWDFEDTNEVAPEEKASNERVDYAFKLHGVSQFYLEAKPLKADLTKADYVKQAITYAYNKGVTWAVLTNFDELRLFNAQDNKPFITLSCKNYLSDFEKLWLLSKESLTGGLLNREAIEYGALPTLLPIEARLYKQLRLWREELLNQLHFHNTKLSFSQIDEVIQKLFDRLIFIRTSEDRNIEERRLLSAMNQWKAGGRKGELIDVIKAIFREFDGYYDSDLFQHHLVDDVFIEALTLEKVIEGLYEIPGGMVSYDFSVIDGDVLGAVYEQYLGHVGSVVKQRAKELQSKMDLGLKVDEKIELTEKRQKRKEHGIYYTPKFVTDYIVRETVGRFLKEHTYNEALNIKILDPACGSGSFLIRAYDELLSYHANQRSKSVTDLGQWERLSVLTKNIFGVDLDRQAVEIARLNLLLRSLARRETLPSLADNIQEGNSLISGTEKELKPYFGNKWREKKPFNWEDEFKNIMSQGGFDVVIGNPPYVGFHGFKEEKDYYRNTYKTCAGRFDLYIPFIEKGVRLLKAGGLLGFICPTNFMKRQHGRELREFIKDTCKILQIVDFQHQQVFEHALNYTGIYIVEKSKPASQHHFTYTPYMIGGQGFIVEQNALDDFGWVFRDQSGEKIVGKVNAQPILTLGNLVKGISEGIVTGKNEVFVLPLIIAGQLNLEDTLLKPVLQGKQIQPYFHDSPQNMVIYPYRSGDKGTEVIPERDLANSYPATWRYLSSRRKGLGGRGYFEESTKNWYELWCERDLSQQAAQKIVVRELSPDNRFALCDKLTFYLDTVCGITLKDSSLSNYLYLLGLLNSSLLEFYYKKTTVPKAGGFYIYKTMFLSRLPIRRIDFANPAEKSTHDKLVALVEKMLDLKKQAAVAKNDLTESKRLQKEISRTDKEIDNLVYDLYGLTGEERKIVEGSIS